MPEHTSPTPKTRLPGLDAEATPVVGIGLGLTGIILGLRPRMAAWPLALTAFAALFYRNPKRVTPDERQTVFAPADGNIVDIDEFYEHRFLHTDAVRLSIDTTPIDVSVQRSPASGVVEYLEYLPGEYRPIWERRTHEHNARQYIGISTEWGPLLIVLTAGPLARRLMCHVAKGNQIEAGSQLSTIRFGARVELILPRDLVQELPERGQYLQAGLTRIGQITPL